MRKSEYNSNSADVLIVFMLFSLQLITLPLTPPFTVTESHGRHGGNRRGGVQDKRDGVLVHHA